MIKYSLIALTAAAVLFSVGCEDSACCSTGKVSSKPTAIITQLPATITGNSYQVVGNTSNDKEDGKSLKKYEWFKTTDMSKTSCNGLTSVATGANPTITGLANGDNRIFLKVTDKDGNTDCTHKDVKANQQANVSCVDKSVHDAKPTAVLNVKLVGRNNSGGTLEDKDQILSNLGEVKSFDKLELTCAGSKDECGRDIPATPKREKEECEYNGRSYLSDSNDCSTEDTVFVSDCKNTGELKEDANTGIVTVTTCGQAGKKVNGKKYNCVKIFLKVTDQWGNEKNTTKVFHASKAANES